MSANLSERAMLASLTISRWQATKTDKKITREIADAHSVNERRAGRYRKYAIDVESPSFKATNSAASVIRHEHYTQTLPWGQDGARILTAANFETYSTLMRKHRASFEQASDAFALDYPRLCENAKTELNGMWDPRDYRRNIRRKFSIELSIMPLPDAADFRASLSDSDVAEIRSNIESELQRTTEAAMRDPYERLYQHIQRMTGALSDPKGIFRDSLVTGLDELCRILPKLNLTNDARFDDLTAKAQGLMQGLDAQQLREVPAIRASVAQRASEIQDAMSAFMGEVPSESA